MCAREKGLACADVSPLLMDDDGVMRPCVCMCVCVCVYDATVHQVHTYIHTYIYA